MFSRLVFYASLTLILAVPLALRAALQVHPVGTHFKSLPNQAYQASFDWPVDTKAKHSITDKQISFIFSAPGKINFDRFSQQLGSNFKLVSISKGGKELKLRIRTRRFYKISSTQNTGRRWIFTLTPDQVRNKKEEERLAALKKKNEFIKRKEEEERKKGLGSIKDEKKIPLPSVPKIPVNYIKENEKETLVFEWDRPTQMAAYEEEGGVWIHFSHPAIFLPPPESGTFVEQEKKATSSSFFLKKKIRLHPRITQKKNHWSLEFSSGTPLIADQAILSFTKDKNKNTYGIVPIKGTGPTIEVYRPKTKRQFTIIPVSTPSQAILSEEKFLQFEYLKTYQGLLIRHKSDQLYVTRLPEHIKITAQPDLFVSENPKADDALDKDFTSLLQFYDWSTSKTPWVSLHEKLKEAAIKNHGVSRLKSTVDLSRFYLESGLTTEAVALLERLKTNTPTLLNDPHIMALYAVGNLIERKYDTAETYLYHPLLNEDPEIHLWQGIFFGLKGEWQEAINKFHYALSYAVTYPPQIRNAVLLYVSESFIMAGNIPETERHLTYLKEANLSAQQVNFLNYIKGLIERAKAKPDHAEKIWKETFEKADPFTKTKIGLALINLTLNKDVPLKKASIKEFENLKFFWRDDYIELDVLKALGLLYYKAELYPESFYSFDLFSKHAKTPKQQKEANQTLLYHLEDLLLKKITKKNIIKALSLYEKHKIFLKKSEKIRAILEKVIQSYLSLDLVDRALIAMTDVRDYLKKEEIFDNTMQQATLLIMDNQERKAINLLLSLSGSTKEQKTQRNHSLARAYLKAGETTKVLDLLKNDKTDEALLIQTLAYRTEKNWFLSAEGFKSLAQKEKDSKVQADLLSQAVISYMLAGKKEDLRDLYAQYAARMKISAHADFFKLMEQSDFDARLNRNSFALMFNTFMNKYEENMKHLISI